MFKFFFTTCLLLICVSFARAQEAPATRESEYLNGAVRTIRTESKSAGTASTDISSSETKVFNLAGQLIEQYFGTLSEPSSNKDKTIYAYRANGAPDQVITYDYRGAVIGKLVYTYDDQGRLSKATGHIRGSLMPFLGAPRDHDYQMTLTYMATGKSAVIEMLVAKEKATEMRAMGISSFFRSVKLYDLRDRLTQEQHFLFDEVFEEKTFTYDAAGRVASIESVKYETDRTRRKTASRETFNYDQRGNVIEEVARDMPSGEVFRKNVFRYEVDRAGNWTKRYASGWVYTGAKKYQEGVTALPPTHTTQRIITYFS